MTEPSRRIGPLAVSPALLEVLARLRSARQQTDVAELDADAVYAVEAGINLVFGDDVLAMFAARSALLAERHGIDLGHVVSATARLVQSGARGDLVALGVAGDRFVCLQKRSQPASGSVLWLTGGTERREVGLLGWLQEVAHGLAAPTSAFAPALIRLTDMTKRAQTRTVLHKSFGRGYLLVDPGGDSPTRKLKVEFPRFGLKVLQARFVEILD